MEEQKAIYGIIGNPLGHSLSPVMHNAAFQALDVDAEYKLFPLKEDQLDEFFKDLKKEDSPIFGLNVTVPYKEHVFQYMDRLSPLAEKIGAVNTIFISKNRELIGYNTDAPGFMAHLAELQFNTADKRIAILGAGGSTRAILTALCMIPERPRIIKIYNRTTSKVDELLSDLKVKINIDVVEPVISIDDLDIPGCDLLINTTSVGMSKEDPSLVEEDLLRPGMLVYDLIYNPPETPLLKFARNQGALTANGLGMLYYQGVMALQRWAETEIDESVKYQMRLALEEALGYE